MTTPSSEALILQLFEAAGKDRAFRERLKSLRLGSQKIVVFAYFITRNHLQKNFTKQDIRERFNRNGLKPPRSEAFQRAVKDGYIFGLEKNVWILLPRGADKAKEWAKEFLDT